MDNKIGKENEEVDLRDYLKFLFSEKRLVLGVSIAAMAVAVIYNFFSPKIYEISVWLEIGKTNNGQVKLIENLSQISKKINNGIYGDFPYGTVVFNPDQTDLLQIKIGSAKPEQAKKDLEKLSEIILADHSEKIKAQKNSLENEIKRLETNVGLLKEDRKNLEALMKTAISTAISDVALLIEKGELSAIKEEIEDSYAKINALKISLSDIPETRIIKPAVISANSIKPKFSLNIILAGLTGLFLGVFIVFWRKWWNGYKNQE